MGNGGACFAASRTANARPGITPFAHRSCKERGTCTCWRIGSRHHMKLLFLLLFVTASATWSVRAQQVTGVHTRPTPGGPGILTGTVTDLQGALIPGVIVEAKERKGKFLKSQTGSDGIYTLSLPAGRYRLSFKSTFGLTPIIIDDYQVPFLLTMHLDVSLPCDDPCKIVY